MSAEPNAERSRGKGAFARILRSEVLLHTKQDPTPRNAESQLVGWGFDVRVQRSLGAISVAILKGSESGSAPKIVLLERPNATVIEDLRLAIEESKPSGAILWILVDPDPGATATAESLGPSVKIVEGLESDLFDAMVWASSMAESGEDGPRPVLTGSRAISKSEDRLTGRVLLAEDNEINRMVVEEILSETDLQLTIAVNGREAVDRVSEGSFDVVLMDCQMPVLDGFEATREIRALEAGGVRCHPSGRIPIVALTANAIRGDQARCLAAGMDEYLTKPFDDAHLLDLLANVLRASAKAAIGKPGSEAIPLSGETPIFAMSDCLERCAGNRGLAHKLVGMLLEQAADEIPEIERAARDGDIERAKQLSHGLRGAAGNLGVLRLHAVLREVEQAIRDGAEPEKILLWTARATDELAAFRDSDPLAALDPTRDPDSTLGERRSR